MPEARAPIAKQPQRGRDVELAQLERRYRSSYKKVGEDNENTTVRLAVKPSDPDFPYEIEALQVQLLVPHEYPKKHCKLRVLNTDIPRGYAFNIEKGFEAYANQNDTTLVRQMGWLDKNLETLLQQSPAETIRFVSASKSSMVAPELPSEFVAAVSAKSQQASKAVTPQPSAPPVVSPADTPRKLPSKPSKKLDAMAAPFFTGAQLEAAAETRRKEMHQLKSRFRESYKIARSDASEIVIQLVVPLNDPHFAFKDLFHGELRLKYHIPAQYPLLPCSIEVENKGLKEEEVRSINYEFSEHVKTGNRSLFQNLNWLYRHLETILRYPPQIKSQRPVEADKSTSSASDSSEKTFTKKPIVKDEHDDKKSRVIVVDDPSMLRPPGVEADDAPGRSSGTSEDESEEEYDSSGGEGDGSNEEQDGKEQPNSFAGGSKVVVRRGTEVRLVSPVLENLSLFRCIAMHLMAKCNRCKDTVEMEDILPKDPINPTGKNDGRLEERWLPCPTCNSQLGAKFTAELVHANAKTVGFLQLEGCKPFDVLYLSFLGTCANCMEDVKQPFHLRVDDQPRIVPCFSCHTKLKVNLGGYKFVSIGQGGESLHASENQVAKTMLKKKKRKEPALVVGQPLPDQGTCSHYRKSKRWFRFPCCGKLYPCDVCHDSKEGHSYDYARRHVCGMCSREQPITAVCACGHEFERTHQKGAFWEGGQGVRNRTLMSRKDPHKHKGVGKTTSKKQERVGAAGKKKRQED